MTWGTWSPPHSPPPCISEGQSKRHVLGAGKARAVDLQLVGGRRVDDVGTLDNRRGLQHLRDDDGLPMGNRFLSAADLKATLLRISAMGGVLPSRLAHLRKTRSGVEGVRERDKREYAV